MNASKENAQKALDAFNRMMDNVENGVDGDNPIDKKDIVLVDQFLIAAFRKLPSEESFQKEKTRKRTKK